MRAGEDWLDLPTRDRCPGMIGRQLFLNCSRPDVLVTAISLALATVPPLREAFAAAIARSLSPD
jgi:hypothetical protein